MTIEELDIREMEYKFVRFCDDTFSLRFRIKKKSFLEPLYNKYTRWRTFYRFLSIGIYRDDSSEKWNEIFCHFKTYEEAVHKLKELYNECPKYKDFYNEYILPEIEKCEEYEENHREYLKEQNALGDLIE